MIIFLKNKHTLQIDEFNFQCSVGKNGITTKKIEGDKKTPAGFFKIEHLYYRKDRINFPKTDLKCIKISEKMGWCNDKNYPRKYNQLINVSDKIGHEKLFREDHKYDLLIPIKFNFNMHNNWIYIRVYIILYFRNVIWIRSHFTCEYFYIMLTFLIYFFSMIRC